MFGHLMGAFEENFGLVGRLYTAAFFLVLVIAVGSGGYYVLGHGHWVWADCLYMTMITLSTVGFGETLSNMADVPYARLWTIGLIFFGSGTLVYFVSTLTAWIIEGDLRGALRRKRMLKEIEALEGHLIVCGAGMTGIHVIEELIAIKAPFIVIEQSEERVLRVQEELRQKFLYLVGDATEDFMLEKSGIARAKGVLATLADDKDNLYITVTARALRPEVRIVAKAVDSNASDKLKRAGANAVVSPSSIGGMRLASEMVRPSVVQFLDVMLRDKENNLRIEEITLSPQSILEASSVGQANLRQYADALLIAIRNPGGSYTYNPRPETPLAAEQTLIVLGPTDEIVKLRKALH